MLVKKDFVYLFDYYDKYWSTTFYTAFFFYEQIPI